MTSGAVPRVLYVWDADYPWDIRTEKICRALADTGCAVAIVARNPEWRPLREALPEGTVLRMPPWRAIGRALDRALSFPAFLNPRWIAHLRAGIREHRPDVVMVRDLPLAPTALWEARRSGLPVVLDMAENYPAMIRDIWSVRRAGFFDVVLRNPRAVEAVERYIVPRMDHVLTVVEESSARLREMGLPPEAASVVSNTPSKQRVRQREPHTRPADGPLRLVYLGLLEMPRGVLEAIDAVSRLASAGRQVELTVIGDGRDRARFEHHAATLGLRPPTIQFLGRVPNAEAIERLRDADVGLVPHHALESWNTTVPNKLFDYMAAGIPVVTSDAVPAARIVRETGAGLVFRSQDAEDLAAQLTLLYDPALRRRMAAAGATAIQGRFNWESDVERLVAVVRDVAAQGPRRSS